MEKKALKIIFLGTPEIAATVLVALLEAGYPIQAVVTRIDKPKGRSAREIESPVKVLARKHNLAVFQPKDKIELEDYILKEKPDLIIVCAFGMILTEKTLLVPKFKAINVHPSLLPKYRGPWPIGAPILAGDPKTGTTIMLMSAGMDEGDILAQKELPLTGAETTPELTEKLASLSASLLIETLPKWLEGDLAPQPQDNGSATYTKMKKKEDGRIDWDAQTGAEIERMSRAFSPWPGVYTTLNGKKLDLFDLKTSEVKLKPGETKFENNCLVVGCKNGSISIAQVKIEGKTRISASDFLKGYPDILKTTLGK